MADHVAVVEENTRLKKFRGVCDTCGWRTDWSYDEPAITAEAEFHIIKKRTDGSSTWSRT